MRTDNLYDAIDEVCTMASNLEYALMELERAYTDLMFEYEDDEELEFDEYLNSEKAELKDVMKKAYRELSQFELEEHLHFYKRDENED